MFPAETMVETSTSVNQHWTTCQFHMVISTPWMLPDSEPTMAFSLWVLSCSLQRYTSLTKASSSTWTTRHQTPTNKFYDLKLPVSGWQLQAAFSTTHATDTIQSTSILILFTLRTKVTYNNPSIVIRFNFLPSKLVLLLTSPKQLFGKQIMKMIGRFNLLFRSADLKNLFKIQKKFVEFKS